MHRATGADRIEILFRIRSKEESWHLPCGDSSKGMQLQPSTALNGCYDRGVAALCARHRDAFQRDSRWTVTSLQGGNCVVQQCGGRPTGGPFQRLGGLSGPALAAWVTV